MAAFNDSIAFIGLGVMGYPMAVNLRSKMDPNTTLAICDVSESTIVRFQNEMQGKGPIKVVQNGYEAASVADRLITMLPTGGVVDKVYLDKETGILAGVKAAMKRAPVTKVLMECGTIEIEIVKKVSGAVTDLAKHLPSGSRLEFVDAPVSGGPMGAEIGSLTFMVGTEEPNFTWSIVTDLLQHMGNKDGIFLCGKVGAGTAFKVINNYLSAITSLAASEALNIGTKLGLDPRTLTDVINVSGGQCWVTSKSNPVPGVQKNVPASRNYEGGFRIELCKKVLKMGSDLAAFAGAKTYLDKPTLAAFDECANDPRYAGKDARVVYKWLNEANMA